ncbi:MAG: NADH-quinone oxidoreductase subunit H [Polyangia bacterium]|jgi:formate hydrogenlyase subunit 4
MTAARLGDLAVHLGLLLLLPPLLPGLIAKTKAVAAGRRGPPILQLYRDIGKLLGKGAVYSNTTTWLFRAGPVVSLAAVLAAGLLLPLLARAPFGFAGDVIVFAYLLGLGRFFTMVAALDTGSSFEGMGASREAAFSALAEPTLFLVLAILCLPAKGPSFAAAFSALPWQTWLAAHPPLIAAAVALFIVLLSENSRIPIDDPNTHLELTMIHEVMVLDHGGPDLAFILYGSAVKLFLFAALLVHVLIPVHGRVAGLPAFLLGMVAVAVAVGIVESITARLRLLRVPQFLVGAGVVAVLGLLVLVFRGTP